MAAGTADLLSWVLFAGLLTLAVGLASWAERRYFLAAHWSVWVMAGVAYARAHDEARSERRTRAGRWLQRVTLACLALATVAYPAYAWRQYREWPAPSPAYAEASRWVNRIFGPNARVAITGSAQKILYEVNSTDVRRIEQTVGRDWEALAAWLRAEAPDVVLVGPEPLGSRPRRSQPGCLLLRDPGQGGRVGLTLARSFPARAGTVYAFVPARLPAGYGRQP
jgi:hypothetical protein